jgi:hypothetical protein
MVRRREVAERISCFSARHSVRRAEWRRRLSEWSWVDGVEVLEVGGEDEEEENEEEDDEGEGRERRKGFRGV